MKITKYFVCLACILLLSSCGDEDSEDIAEVIIKETVILERVQKISTNDITLNDQEAIAITVGPTGAKFITIKLYKSNIQEGYSVLTTSNSDPAISVEANWDETSFFQASNNATNVNFKIVTLDVDNLMAKINFSAVLIDPITAETLVINESLLELGGISFNLFIEGRVAPSPELAGESELDLSPEI